MPLSGKPVSNKTHQVASASDEGSRPLMASGTTGPADKPGDKKNSVAGNASIPVAYGVSLVGTADRLTKLTMKRATLLSVTLHLISPFLVAILAFLLVALLSWLFHFDFSDWFQQKSKPRDIEFTLVRDTHAKQPDKPLFKGSFNQRAGGKQSVKQPTKAVEEPPQPSATQKDKTATPPKPQKIQPEKTQANEAQPEKPSSQTAKAETVKSLPPATFKPTIAKPEKQQKTAQSAVQKSSQSAKTASSQTAASSASPSLNKASDDLLGSDSQANPQKGSALDPGVDVAQDVDFGPFMADLERRIKRNWSPPRGAESRKVMLLFYLSREGKVVKIETRKSSGDESTDQAAIEAVEASAPFKPFPPQVKEDILPVEFSFDYNVLNPKNPKQALKW